MMKPKTRSRLATLGIGILALMLSIVPGIASARQHTELASPIPAPIFSFPTNGTSYPSNGPYLFQVQPVSGATGYLWSFVQNGMIVYQNLAWDGHLSSASYTVSTSSKAHSLIHSGDLHVWVRALMKDGTWSATGAVMIRIQGKGGPQPRPTVNPQTNVSNVLYQANWTTGMAGWSGPHSWKSLSGMLINDGSDSGLLLAPYQVNRTANYAVEAQIQYAQGGCGSSFGIVARKSDNGYYAGGVGAYCGWFTSLWAADSSVGDQGINVSINQPGVTQLATGDFRLDNNWHTFRLEVKDNLIRLLVDGGEVARAIDNHNLAGAQVGLWCRIAQINVRSFKVIAL